MASTFQNLSFGPMHLRPVLRKRLERHEHLIAWGPAAVGDPQPLFHMAMGMMPGVGPALAAMAASSSKRFVVVTSRRLLVLLNRKPNVLARGEAVCFEAQHEYLSVARPGTGHPATFLLTTRDLPTPMRLTVDTPKKPRGRRLMEALEALTVEPDVPAGPRAGRP